MIQLAIALVIAVVLAGTHWKAYHAGGKSVQAEWDKSILVANDQARDLEKLNRKSKEVALENRTQEIVRNVAAADRARIAAERLHNASERSLQAARVDHSACLVSAATHAELFGYCQREYRGMAEKADGHATDVKALTEAWPR